MMRTATLLTTLSLTLLTACSHTFGSTASYGWPARVPVTLDNAHPSTVRIYARCGSLRWELASLQPHVTYQTTLPEPLTRCTRSVYVEVRPEDSAGVVLEMQPVQAWRARRVMVRVRPDVEDSLVRVREREE